jgi:hypothetical protein
MKIKVYCDEKDCQNSTELDFGVGKIERINWKCDEHKDKNDNNEIKKGCKKIWFGEDKLEHCCGFDCLCPNCDKLKGGK